VETLERIRIGLPFALRAVDLDNVSDFVNDRLIEYCLSHGIELTRSRPYRKNYQAWVEQKNGAIVRKLLGYRRFEGLAAARAITRLYGASRLFVNFFQPSFKLGRQASRRRSSVQALPRTADPVRATLAGREYPDGREKHFACHRECARSAEAARGNAGCAGAFGGSGRW
jgi:hypothetical protein